MMILGGNLPAYVHHVRETAVSQDTSTLISFSGIHEFYLCS